MVRLINAHFPSSILSIEMGKLVKVNTYCHNERFLSGDL